MFNSEHINPKNTMIKSIDDYTQVEISTDSENDTVTVTLVDVPARVKISVTVPTPEDINDDCELQRMIERAAKEDFEFNAIHQAKVAIIQHIRYNQKYYLEMLNA